MGFLQFLVFFVMISIYLGISGLLVVRLLGRYKAVYTNSR
jgi:hypothetical protein